MKIVAVTFTEYRTPFIVPFTVTYGTQTSSEHLLISVKTDGELVGVGDATPLGIFTGESLASAASIIRDVFAPRLVGKDPLELGPSFEMLDRTPGNPAARSGTEMALMDLQGKVMRAPIHRVLGGKLVDEVAVSSGIGIKPVEETVAEARSLLDKRITAFKLKVGGDVDDEAARVKAVRDAAGKGVTLRIDANAGYSVKRAVALGKKVGPFDLQYFEQPVDGRDLAGMREVRQAIDTPVMADESIHTPSDALAVIQTRSADILGVKFAKCGGMRSAKKILAVAEAAGLPCVMISAFETGLGWAANAHVAATAPNCTLPNDLALWTIQKDDPTVGISVDGGKMKVPDAPGLGVALAV